MKSVGWFDSLPAKWSSRRLKYAAKLGNTRTDGRPDGARYLGLGNVESWTGRLVESEVTTGNAEDAVGADSVVNCFERGDVLFGKLRPYLAKAHLVEAPGVCTTELLVTKPEHDVDGRFLLYAMLNEGFISLVDSSAFGSKMPRADWDFIGGVRVPVPPLTEQRAIAGYLDREMGRLDALVTAKERWLELLAEKRRALITQAVTRGLNPAAPLRDSGLPWLGQIPKHWQAIRLKFLGRCKGGAGFPHEDQGLQGQAFFFFKVKDLAQQNNDAYLRETDNSISRETAENLRATVFPKDTIVFAKVGAALLLQRFKLLAQPSCIDNNMMGFMAEGTKFDVSFALHTFSLFNLCEIVNTGAVTSMNEEQVNDLCVPVPPTLGEQRTIVAYIGLATAKLDRLRAVTERTISLLKERRAALIAVVVTGKLKVCASVTDERSAAVV
jgi:type I restriction enzyme S subunit